MEENRTEELTEETAVADQIPAEAVAPAEEAVPAEEIVSEVKEDTKATPKNMALMIGAIVVVIAVIIALLAGTFGVKVQDSAPATEPAVEETVPATVPADGNPDDETCKGTYTVSNAELAAEMDTVVATAGEYELTNGKLQVYYWLGVQSFLQNCSYYSNAYGIDYAALIGLDYTQPLDTQICPQAENGSTWQQYFLLNALQSWHYYESLYAEAIKADFDVTAEKREFLDNLETAISEDAATYGFASAEEYLTYNAGPGATMENYKNFMERNYRGYDYYQTLVDAIELTDAEIEAYYTENEAIFTEQGITKDQKLVDVRHILIMPAADATTGAVTDEAWAAAAAEAQEILATWKNGGNAEEREANGWTAAAGTEELFAEMANTLSADGGSNTNGGLYTDVYQGQMVEPFENWCFDETRKTGDSGLVQTSYGWHIMYYVQNYPSTQWMDYAKDALKGVRSDEIVNNIASQYPLTVDYSKILLGFLDMGA